MQSGKTAVAALRYPPGAPLHHAHTHTNAMEPTPRKQRTWKRRAFRMHRTQSVFPPFAAIPCVHTTRVLPTKGSQRIELTGAPNFQGTQAR